MMGTWRKSTVKILLAVSLALAAGLGCNLMAPTALSPTMADATPTARSSAMPDDTTAVAAPTEVSPIAAPSPGGPFCNDSQPPVVTDLQVYPMPDLPEPPARTPYRDPVFGSCLVRLSDRTADLAPGDPSSGIKNEYSRVQSFNADGRMLLARSIEAHWYVYNAATFEPLGELPLGVDPRWDAANPNLIVYNEDTRLMSYDVQTGQQALVHEFAADFPGRTLAAVWSRYEGRPSMDGRYWGLMAEDDEWRAVALLVYDRLEDRVIATRELPHKPELDSVTISPSGRYLLAYDDEYCDYGELGDDEHPCGLMVYDQGLDRGRGLLRIIGHSDLALDAQGREVLVFQDIDRDELSVLDLESGGVTALWPIDFSHSPIGFHFSGLAYQAPGWALVSTYSGARPSATWMDDQVFAMELLPGGRVVRLAHTHSVVDETQEHDYWAEPHASVDPDFNRVLFTSNWGRSGTGEVEVFMISVPSGSIASTP